MIDFSNYFFNCSHDVIHNIHKKYIKNDDVIRVIEDYLFIGEGIALGIEIAQKEASIIPNVLDHYIRNKYFIERYMDDSIYVSNDYNIALNMLKEYVNKAKELGIVINQNKTKIISINNYFKYCKWHYKILDSGKIVLVPNKSTIYRQRRKLRKMYKLYNIDKITYENIDISKISFCSYLNIGNSYQYIKYLKNRFNRM